MERIYRIGWDAGHLSAELIQETLQDRYGGEFKVHNVTFKEDTTIYWNETEGFKEEA